MRKYTSLAVLVLILILEVSSLCNSNNAELGYIRKAYISELGIPPSLSEIEWLMEYKSKNVKESGIDYILDRKYGKEQIEIKNRLKHFYLNNQSKNELTISQQEKIIKYQAGNLNLTLEQAKTILVSYALIAAENHEDPVDYLFLCLCGRYTNVQEANLYGKVLRTRNKTNFENMYLVLELILNNSAFLLY
jgi:hypothetical protein